MLDVGPAPGSVAISRNLQRRWMAPDDSFVTAREGKRFLDGRESVGPVRAPRTST